MTGTPFDDLAGAELMLRERFEQAVGGLAPDTVRLVAEGTADGRDAVRRRRVLSGIAAAAIAAIAAGSITYATQNDLLGGDDHATNNGQLIEMEPATPRGLAAAVIQDTGEVGTLLAAGGTKSAASASADLVLSGQVAYDLGGGVGVELDVYARTDTSGLGPSVCGDASNDVAMTVCRSFTLPDGTRAWYVEYGPIADAGNGVPGVVSGVVAARADQLVSVVQTMSGTTDFALDQSELAEIAADPAVGVSTTHDLNVVGQGIANFNPHGLMSGQSEGSSSGGGTAPPPTRQSKPPVQEPHRGSGDASSASAN